MLDRGSHHGRRRAALMVHAHAGAGVAGQRRLDRGQEEAAS